MVIPPPPGRVVRVEVLCLHERSCEHFITGKVYSVKQGVVSIGGARVPTNRIKSWRPAARAAA